jgi:hypothetical protein
MFELRVQEMSILKARVTKISIGRNDSCIGRLIGGRGSVFDIKNKSIISIILLRLELNITTRK